MRLPTKGSMDGRPRGVVAGWLRSHALPASGDSFTKEASPCAPQLLCILSPRRISGESPERGADL